MHKPNSHFGINRDKILDLIRSCEKRIKNRKSNHDPEAVDAAQTIVELYGRVGTPVGYSHYDCHSDGWTNPDGTVEHNDHCDCVPEGFNPGFEITEVYMDAVEHTSWNSDWADIAT